MTLTHHASVRRQQRGIDPDHIRLTLDYGVCTHERGARIYFMADKAIPKFVRPADRDRLRRLTVVESADGDILTVYRKSG